jgi:hypothetical protein
MRIGWILVASASAVTVLTAAEPATRYQMHLTGASCVVAPCPQWQVTDQRTGEQFYAVVDFSAVGMQPPGLDLAAEAERKDESGPNGLSYTALRVTSILKGAPPK